ncbi:DNA topoisomerase 3-alpha [Linum perenne]
MITVLNVAEKPSVAKSVAGILSRNQARMREGRSRYNKIYEFNYTINGQPCHMLMTSVTGHLMEMDFDDRFRKWHSCDPADLYQAPIRKFVPEDKLDIKRSLEEEARKCQWLVLWLDCDREGENIAFEVVEVCRTANSRLTIRRARFSSLIDREIHQAVQNLVAPNQLFSDAVDARQEIDLRIGASFTRFQTMLLRDKFVITSAQDERNLVLSYGPCQFPTLGFIVERYWEIQSHEPEEFWTINCTYNSDEGIATFNWIRGHLFDYVSAVALYEMCVEEPTATVTKVQQQEKLKYPPYPLSTIELEKRSSRYFHMSSERTMKVAEELYQSGFISYPRTETDSFSSRTELQAIAQEQAGHPHWGSYAQRLLDPEAGLWRNPGSGGHDDKAHPPIHPTKYSAGETNWSQDHHKNYLDVYRFESWGNSVLPTFAHGQQFIPATLTLDSGVTRPPPLLSEADLLGCMDKGEALVMGYDEMGYELWKPNLRSMMEYDMKEVSVGHKSKADVLAACLQQMKACFLDAKVNRIKLLDAMAIFFERSDSSGSDDHFASGEMVCLCRLCQESNMVLKRNRCRNVVWLPGPVLEATVTTNTCSSCAPGPVYLIQFKFRQVEIPPGFNVDHLGCIGGCDETLRQLTEMCGTGNRGQGLYLRHSAPMASNPRQGQNPCIYCNQAGHASMDCPTQQQSASRSARNRGTNQQNQQSSSSVSCSTCGSPCTVRTANTANNRGRKFYSCNSQACNFFVWEDSLANGVAQRSAPRQANSAVSSSSAASSRRRGGGRSNSSRGRGVQNGGPANDATFVTATGESISGRRCYVCGDPSHFANSCPNRGNRVSVC